MKTVSSSFPYKWHFHRFGSSRTESPSHFRETDAPARKPPPEGEPSGSQPQEFSLPSDADGTRLLSRWIDCRPNWMEPKWDLRHGPGRRCKSLGFFRVMIPKAGKTWFSERRIPWLTHLRGQATWCWSSRFDPSPSVNKLSKDPARPESALSAQASLRGSEG